MYNKSGFTLTEFIVIFTIISILSTLGGIFLLDYFKNTRDAVRISSLQSISNALELFYIDNYTYPHPDLSENITYSGSTIWTQGIIGDEVTRKLRVFGSDIPRDHHYDTYFAYSITNNSQEYQMATIIEGDLEENGTESYASFSPQAHASVLRAYVVGNYNKIMLMLRDESQYTFIASPSIISSNLESNDIIDIISGQYLVYHDFYNLPQSYSSKIFTDGGFDFNALDPVIYIGDIETLNTQQGLQDFVEKLKFIYARTPTENSSFYTHILQQEGLAMIQHYFQKIFSLRVGGVFSCQDWYDMGELISDGYHLITGVNNETKTLYCSIDNEQRVWTRIERNFLGSQGGSFAGGNHISTHSFNLFSTPSANEIVTLQSPKNSGYALRQQGENLSNYEIKMKDFSHVLSGDEIRLSLWARGDYSGEWINDLGFNPHVGYLFYNRLYYSDGSFSTNGEMKLIDTQMIGGEQWNKYEVRHRVRKTPQDFFWYIGLDAADNVDFYFTGVNIEVFRR